MARTRVTDPDPATPLDPPAPTPAPDPDPAPTPDPAPPAPNGPVTPESTDLWHQLKRAIRHRDKVVLALVAAEQAVAARKADLSKFLAS